MTKVGGDLLNCIITGYMENIHIKSRGGNMKQEELISKGMRISAWEQSQTVPEMSELITDLPGDRPFVIGDFFEIRQDKQGNFQIENNRTMTV